MAAQNHLENNTELFQKLYKTFYYFCLTDSFLGDDRLKNQITDSNDQYLKDFYNIVIYIVNNKTSRFKELKTTLEGSWSKSNDGLTTDTEQTKINQWRLYSLLCLAYQYRYFNTEELTRYTQSKKALQEELHLTDITLDITDYKIRRHINKSETFYGVYQNKFSERSFHLENRNFLMILKSYSSSSPFFYPAMPDRFHQIPIKGGGFFLKWKNYGIAIDPGINFMENMHRNDLYIKDINAVIVTHNHIDHNGDLLTIDDMAYQFAEKTSSQKYQIKIYCDKGTETQYSRIFEHFEDYYVMQTGNENTAPIYLDTNQNIGLQYIHTEHTKTYTKTYYNNDEIYLWQSDQYIALHNFFPKTDDEWISSDDLYVKNDDQWIHVSIELLDFNGKSPFSKEIKEIFNEVNDKYKLKAKALKEEQIKITKDLNGYVTNSSWAVKLTLRDTGEIKKKIGFTSDTRYMNSLSEFFQDCDYIVANISEFDLKDYQKESLKDIHLGYHGCFRLITAITKKYKKTPKFILSEFWAGKGDIRREIVKKLKNDTNYQWIYPGDVGMMFLFDKLDVSIEQDTTKCSETETFRCSFCHSEYSMDKLHIIRNGVEYAPLVTVCEDCIL